MKKITYICLALMLGVFTMTSCEREQIVFDNYADDRAQGTVNLSSIEINVDEDASVPTRAQSTNLNNYVIRIYEETNTGSLEVRNWNYADMPELFTLPVGNYRAVAASAAVEPSATFDGGYWEGESNFTITANTVTDVATIFCKFQSIKVTVSYEDSLRMMVSDDLKVTISIEDGGSLEYTLDETRPGYFQAVKESNVLKACLTGTVEGELIEYETAFPNVKAGEFRAIRYTFKVVNNGEMGSGGTADFKLSIDATCEIVNEKITVNPGEEEEIEDFPADKPNDEGSEGEGGDSGNEGDGDDTGNTPNENAPSVEGLSYKGEAFDIKGSYDVEGQIELKVLLKAPLGMAHVNVTIDSETLTSDILTGVGLDTEFDLAEPGSLEAGLQGLGFPTGSAVVGQEELIFDITAFTSLLGIYGAANHRFIIEVVDQEGNSVTETLTLITK